MNAISVRALTKDFGSLRALDDVSFEISSGEFFGLLGPNGAGKTTLISVLGCLTRPTLGTASVMGSDVTSDPLGAQRMIGIVPQETVYDPFFTVRQSLRQQSSFYGIRRNDDWIDELLDRLVLSDKSDTNTRKLSGGMRRRLVVAMALVHKPPVVVLDEPSAGVDVNLRRSLWDFIRDLNQAGTTVLLTTHYLNEAEVLCDRIALMKEGRIIADEPKDKLLAPGRYHKCCVHLRLSNNGRLPLELSRMCPPGSHSQNEHRNGRHCLLLENYSQLETILATLRKEGMSAEELEVSPPDLEDVFMAVMSEER